MDRTSCRFERMSNLVIGMVLLAISFGFLVIGVTLLPVFGILFAIPILAASILFFKARRSPECLITTWRRSGFRRSPNDAGP